MITKLVVVGMLSAVGVSVVAWKQASGVASGATKAQVGAPAPASTTAMLPTRLLECHLGRITNVDPTKEKLPAKLEYEGNHLLKLFLPAIPVRTTEPPRSTLPPEPVDPKTRILADPDGIAAGAAARPFERVVDYWPERVEMTTPIGGGEVNLIVLQPSDGRPGLTDIFMTKAKDAATYDSNHMYSGRCEAKLDDAAKSATG